MHCQFRVSVEAAYHTDMPVGYSRACTGLPIHKKLSKWVCIKTRMLNCYQPIKLDAMALIAAQSFTSWEYHLLHGKPAFHRMTRSCDNTLLWRHAHVTTVDERSCSSHISSYCFTTLCEWGFTKESPETLCQAMNDQNTLTRNDNSQLQYHYLRATSIYPHNPTVCLTMLDYWTHVFRLLH